MKQAHYFSILFYSLLFILKAQIPTQTIKGKITDKASGQALAGAVVVVIKDSVTGTKGATTNEYGEFKIEGVAVGRRSLKIAYIAYKPVFLNDLIISSGKATYLNIEMEENLNELGTVEVIANDNKAATISDIATVSARTFSVEETERYPGSRQDPARMASNYAGVQGSNDSRNDIVVRGNSPSGLLWRLDDLDIPNPNHFAIAGSAGGPLSIINNKYLGNSDFFTGAFPANYGNALGGVFDLKMKNGNTEKYEHSIQFGLLGAEVFSEGPLSKKSGASYWVSYRYSTLVLLQSLKIRLGTSAVPNYQDAAFKLNFPTKKAGVFSVWGIGGLSNIDIVLSTLKEKPTELYGDQVRDQYFSSNMGVLNFSHVYQVNPKVLIKTNLAHTYQRVSARHDWIFRKPNFEAILPLPQVLNTVFVEQKNVLSSYAKVKFNARQSMRAGIILSNLMYDYFDTNKVVSNGIDTLPIQVNNKIAKNRIQEKSQTFLIQPYVNFQQRFNEQWTLNLGLHSQIFTLNNTATIEPRIGARYQINDKNSLNFGYGLHSQMQTQYIYFAIPDSLVNSNGSIVVNLSKNQANRDLGFSKSHHFIIGHDWNYNAHFRIKTEAYYQYLYNIPVYAKPSGVSLINRGASFTRFFPIYNMENKGTGYNYGLELTVEKFFSKHYFLLVSGSLFDSKFKGSNGKTFNTDYNTGFATNALGGVEYAIGRNGKNAINISGKVTYAGGRLYSPVNRAASDIISDVVPDDDRINTLQFPNYFRTDLRLAYKINSKKVTHEIAFDLVNIFNNQNVLALTYSPDPSNPSADPYVRNYQLAFLPLFYYKVDF
jgi:hypothetical protein